MSSAVDLNSLNLSMVNQALGVGLGVFLALGINSFEI